MTMKSVQLKAQIRENAGKGASRALRRAGQIPAIIYGNNDKEINISIDNADLFQEYRKGDFTSKIVNLEVGKDTIQVLPKEVQIHPVTDNILHVDFMRVNQSDDVRVFVKVKFINSDKSPGIKRGGVLNIVRRSIELICKPADMPNKIEINLSGKLIGESIHKRHISLPDNVKFVIDRDFTIATLLGRGGSSSAAKEEGEGEGEGKSEEASS